MMSKQETQVLPIQEHLTNAEKENASSINDGADNSLSIIKMEVKDLSPVAGGGVLIGD
ncbi:MAG TPA: hypothetical protein VF543_12255 [Pyrinomonadaceae bacterium]